jgi:hypothetical protein
LDEREERGAELLRVFIHVVTSCDSEIFSSVEVALLGVVLGLLEQAVAYLFLDFLLIPQPRTPSRLKSPILVIDIVRSLPSTHVDTERVFKQHISFTD